jgi:hypothetical protein
MKKSIFFISLILTIIISFAAGYFIGQTPLIDKEKIVQQTKEEIKNRLIEAKIINPEPEQILSLSGTVKEVGENYIVVVPSMRQNPFGDIFPGMVKILTNEGTKIEKWTLKSPEEYEKEKEQDSSPYNKEVAQLNDLCSDYFMILARSENDIKGLNEFIATEINFSVENPFEEIL